MPQGVRQELKKTSDEKDKPIVEQNGKIMTTKYTNIFNNDSLLIGISKGGNEDSGTIDQDELKTIPIPACKSKIQFFEQLKSTKA